MRWMTVVALMIAGLQVAVAVGCRSRQVGHILQAEDADLVGSHAAGAATWGPLVHASVGQLLARQQTEIQQVAATAEPSCTKRIAFVGVENRSAEELGDYREQLYEMIDTGISGSGCFAPVSRRFVEAALDETGLAPDQLFIPKNRQAFAASLEQVDAGFDYLLYARVTSGTTQRNKSEQRNYLLTLELVDVATGQSDKESAELRKGYSQNVLAKWKNF